MKPHSPRIVRPGQKKTRREPLEEPSAPVQAPSRTGRRASHLGGLALCGCPPRLGKPYAEAAQVGKSSRGEFPHGAGNLILSLDPPIIRGGAAGIGGSRL